MPLRLEIKKKLVTRTVRVKSVDVHPTLNWLLVGLYNGNVIIYDYSTQATVKTFESTTEAVRSAKFIVRKQWIAFGADDKLVRVYNHNTMEKVKSWEAHHDYIRKLEVHPKLPYLFTSSDDMTIRMWDWDNNWNMVTVFEGHQHYVMDLAINPKDFNQIASACLDRTIKVWGITGSALGNSYFTLKGHEEGVNCVDYCKSGDRPYLASGGDDCTVKIWDYQTKQCIATLEGHVDNISSVSFHPDLPIIISSSEDSSIKLWHSVTYKLETTLNYGMDRAWCIDSPKESGIIALAFDEGSVVLQLGNEFPIADFHNGLVTMIKNMEVQTTNLKMLKSEEVREGEKLSPFIKDLGNSEVFAQSVKFNYNGQLFAVSSDTEYVIYTSRIFKNADYGTGSDFVWSSSSDTFAVRGGNGIVKFMFLGSENKSVKVGSFECLFGGEYLGVKETDSLSFYDWEMGCLVRRIEAEVENVYWGGVYVCLSLDEGNSYVLRSNPAIINDALHNAAGVPSDDGIHDAFVMEYEITDSIESGYWIGETFLYVNKDGKLNYFIRGRTTVVAKPTKKMMILGYVEAQNRIYLIDKSLDIVSYELLLPVLEYEQAIAREDMTSAAKILERIPLHKIGKIAKLLEKMGYKEMAFEITNDDDHKFDLAIQLCKIEAAIDIVKAKPQVSKWKQLGDIALLNGYFDVAELSFKEAQDLNSLFLYYTSCGDKGKIEELRDMASNKKRRNIEFMSNFLLNDTGACINTLLSSKRYPEAALFARSYAPSQIPGLIDKWKDMLAQNAKILPTYDLGNPLELEEDIKDEILNTEKELGEFYSKVNLNSTDYEQFITKFFTQPEFYKEFEETDPNKVIVDEQEAVGEEVKEEEELVKEEEEPVIEEEKVEKIEEKEDMKVVEE